MPSSSGRFAVVTWLVASMLVTFSARAEEPGGAVVVFVSPPAFELTTALHDALLAQLSGAGTELLFEHFSADGTGLRKQVTEARALAAAHRAIGVFWLDAPADKDWLLYLAEPGGDRVLVRRITIEADGLAAATEAVAVITAESSQALAAGQTIGMRPVALPPVEPRPAPTPAPREVSPPRLPEPQRVRRFFVGVAYYGDGPAHELRWQSGARFSVGMRFRSGLYLNAGYQFFQDATVKGPNLTFQVARNPIDAGVGVAIGRHRVVPSLEVRVLGEVLTRESLAASGGLSATPNTTRARLFVSPRLRLDVGVGGAVGLYVAGGLDAALNSFSFVSRIDGRDQTQLTPYPVRPSAELGASFSL